MKFDNAEIITAMVTPFDEGGQVSYERLEKLINHLLNSGTKGILVSGTTGEAPTLTRAEKIELIKKTVEFVKGRVPIIAGTGSNSTAQTIDFTNEVAKIKGVDAVLVVVPYYNKPDQRGMIAHFTAVAKASPLPIIIYNIPGRTGVTMEVPTIATLAKNENIIGIKDCTGNVNLSRIVAETPDDFLTYTGEDADALAAKTVGAKGVISVAAHIFGNKIEEMYTLVEQGKYKAAGSIMRELTPKIAAVFSAPSPSPVKAVLNYEGIEVGGCRLPILELPEDRVKQLVKTLNI
ncbi:4-hydroxy-tetrahydrodipicolinate synthase [Liquorilactobacillus mali]|uniref:4-hydroxy-tetrahydrodipicolinate synthase n=2 Tax=Liquorilactobacillus mali TaxID=1618 RepID=A0A0R2E5W8_9LACO|nr:4-hydroxy-tetrahydrodipicolinate synthase [Liquorilactobacillus mali]KRN10667.1 dihydrodipicolinate synthase [Liquorilactobacillus mali KCTC 3596 = DSM 20444]MDC7951995.1 4-hydroxy-tetrahydrodipicolinate synthase [Liquorilactobacillus mali]QFQ74910.1 4-hydroxy-tetrahydrodipicolinate synthase [Liquorilactobacillus mali]